MNGKGECAAGNSFANGPDMPKWARNWEFRLLQESQTDRWKVEA